MVLTAGPSERMLRAMSVFDAMLHEEGATDVDYVSPWETKDLALVSSAVSIGCWSAPPRRP